MAPRTVGGLTGGMAYGGHIHSENYGFISAKGPVPTFAFSRILDFHLGNLGPVAHSGHTPRTTLGGYIPEFIDLEGPVPLLIASHGHVSHLRNRRTMAHDEHSQGMAMTGHILLGNHAVNHTKGPTLISTPGHGLDPHLRNLCSAAYGGRTLRTTRRSASQSSPT